MWLRLRLLVWLVLFQVLKAELIEPGEKNERPIMYGCVDHEMADKLLRGVNLIESKSENILLKLNTISPASSNANELSIQDVENITTNIRETVKTLLETQKNEFSKCDSAKSELQQFIATSIENVFKEQQKSLLDALQRPLKPENLKFSEKYLASTTGICNADKGLPENCEEALRGNANCTEGVYLLYVPEFGLDPFYAYCLPDYKSPDLPTWTIIQWRQSTLYDFNRTWNDYRDGFGDVKSTHWLGLKYVHALTTRQNYELWIEMEDWEGTKRFATYDKFVVGSEKNKFPLSLLGRYGGNAGDSLTIHAGQKFTTIDSDNDSRNGNCAEEFSGGWWFYNCHVSNPNGVYNSTEYGKGINWKSWRGYNYSYKQILMGIRPRET